MLRVSISLHFYFPNMDNPPLRRLYCTVSLSVEMRPTPEVLKLVCAIRPALKEFTRHHEGVGHRITQYYGAIAAEPSSAIFFFDRFCVFVSHERRL